MVCGHHLQKHSFVGVVLLIASHFQLLSLQMSQHLESFKILMNYLPNCIHHVLSFVVVLNIIRISKIPVMSVVKE